METAINLPALSQYLAHTVLGRTMADIARGEGAFRSTVLRRVRSVEALTECPAWCALIKAVADDLTRPVSAFDLDRPTGEGLLTALGPSEAEARAALRRAGPPLSGHNRLVIDGTARPAPIVTPEGRTVTTVDMGAALAWLALGFVTPTASRGGLSTLALTTRGRAASRVERPGRARLRPVSTDPGVRIAILAAQAKLTDPQAALAADISGLLDTDATAARARLGAVLPGWMVEAVEALIGPEPADFDAVATGFGLPLRSSRAILICALDVLAMAEAAR